MLGKAIMMTTVNYNAASGGMKQLEPFCDSERMQISTAQWEAGWQVLTELNKKTQSLNIEELNIFVCMQIHTRTFTSVSYIVVWK